MSWQDLGDMEKLVYMQEAYNRLGAELKVNGSGIRGRMDRRFREMYENPETRTKSRDLIIEGHKVGTYSLSVTEAKPEGHDLEFRVTDRETLEGNDDFDFRSWVAGWVNDNIGDLARQYFEETGEVIDGCDLVDIVIPATEMRIGSTSLRIDHRRFDEALGGELPDAISGYLSESNR